jgi:hypothetical protein
MLNGLQTMAPLLCEYEQQLNAYLGTNECAVVGNGTLEIQLAMRALGVKGEVITTPFSYVATTSSIVWEGCIPVFVDVDATTLNIDPVKIEASIRGKCDYKTASDASPEYVYQMTNYFSNFISESRSFKRKIMRSYSKLFHGLGRTNYDWPHIIPFNKSPHLMNKLGYVGALFPRSTLIVIVRNIYSHSASMKIHFDKLHQMTGRTYIMEDSPTACYSQTLGEVNSNKKAYPGNFSVIPTLWMRMNKLAFDDLETSAFAKKIVVSYEDLVTHQKDILTALFNALNLREEHAHIAQKIANESTVLVNTTTQGNPLDKWETQLLKEEISAIDDVIAADSASYAYIQARLHDLKIQPG